MANEREVFTILEDAAGAGIALKGKTEGLAVAGVVHAPAIVAKKSGNGVLLPVEVEGTAFADAVPVLVGKDAAGNLRPLKVDDQGAVLTTMDVPGTILEGSAAVAAVVGTLTACVSLALTIDKIYDQIDVVASCTFPTYWEIQAIDDGATTVKARFLTGPGQFSFEKLFENLKITAGDDGVQSMVLAGKQLTGKASDLNGYLSAIERL